MSGTNVCVIIAARNAAETITTAITSALLEPEVSEIVVVDDASTDATEAMARATDDGSGRLLVLRLDVNRGPSFARNMAIRQSRAPLISILDADDFFLPGRFARLVASDDWELVADNIVFVEHASVRDVLSGRVAHFDADPTHLDVTQFIAGNISSRGARRGELGFLKPVMRRAMLEAHGLHYDEQLRLGEDYALYAEAMLKGARFKLIRSCGYCAIVRPNSLSGQHRTEDLRRLADADLRLLAQAGLATAHRPILRRHERHVRDKYRLRHFLDLKAANGLSSAMAFAFASPANLGAVAKGVTLDKLEPLRLALSSAPKGCEPSTRYLMPGTASAGGSA
ncbi:glycosyltransferase family 2 protein [Aminobacter anthyllidis]|uniref:Glycosyltransferase family 2 protein n=1 Tax=Aminobacter anthyllidis TaxID=1035067 RepID=A0A9X1D738_9HYPH|nr:glycosyltransferase family 2 protein [Aminobacter anthyllidis]